MTDPRPGLALLAAILLYACAAAPRSPDTADTDATLRAQLTSIEQWFPGNYSNHGQARRDNAGSPGILELNITPLGSADVDTRSFLLQQVSADDEDMRQFVYLFSIRPGAAYLELNIARIQNPVAAANGEPPLAEPFRPGCELRMLPVNGGLAGNNDIAGCRFQGLDGRVQHLNKEVAIYRDQIHIADQVLTSVSADSVELEQRHQFYRKRWFSGWAGIKRDEADLSPGNQWRLADTFRLHSEGDRVQLTDGSGSAMGYALQLARTHYRSDQPPILRLALIDLAENRIVAYSWADPSASQLGLNLGWFQTGLILDTP